MKCKIPEISWHNRDPVLSVDIQPKPVGSSSSNYRLASGGTDAHVLIWYMKVTSGDCSDIELDLAADLTRHQRAVNVVKWSPNGELLASGDDESVVFIWKQKSDNEVVNIVDTTNEQDKEVWITLKVLRGHMEDIYDLSWAPNSLFLVTGSVDNSAMLWDVQKGKSMAILSDHKGFVQGVAWDPKNQYIATLSTDRYLRIFDIQTKKVLHRISKSTLPVSEDNPLHGKRMRLFHDDTLQTFFRRLSFTPDGKFLLAPSGVTDYDGCERPLNTTYIFSRYGLRQPAIVLPCPDQYTVAVRCCPILYRLRPHNVEKNPPVIPLPYRMIFAVATKSSIYFYDTQQKQPFAMISNIHYTRLTDITWSDDGRIVVVSSTDGFCSLITFEDGELGEVYEDSSAVLAAALAQVIAKNGKAKKTKDSEGRARKPSTDDSVQSKENAHVQKEPVLTKISEKENTENEIKTTNVENADKNTKSNNEATPIGIKRKPGPVDSTATNLEKDSQPKATPIAIKRKPGPVASTTNMSSETKSQATPIAIKRKPGPIDAADQKQATPIAIKRKPGPVEDNKQSKETSDDKPKEESTPPAVTKAAIPTKVLTADIILDKQILSSEEKFESPEKKSRPVTPISVRRHPRTPSTQTPTQATQSPTTFTKLINSQADQTPTSISNQSKTPRQDKKATPIAVRKAPRNLISTPSRVSTPNHVEEAMDAWPSNKETEASTTSQTKEDTANDSKKLLKESGVTPLPSEETCEHTEDIRLVYEETVEDPLPTEKETKMNTSKDNVSLDTAEKTEIPARPETPNNKTPRRVALKTISTPKSKKKLLD